MSKLDSSSPFPRSHRRYGRPAAALGLCVVLAACAAAPGPRVRPARDATDEFAAAMQVHGSTTGNRVRAGVGRTVDPSTVLLQTGADFATDNRIYFGPQLQLGVDDHESMFTASLQVGRDFDLSDAGGFLGKLVPYAQAGIGYAYLEDDRLPASRDDDDGLLLSVGGGVRYEFAPKAHVGVSATLNLLPGDVLGEEVFLSVQFVELALDF